MNNIRNFKLQVEILQLSSYCEVLKKLLSIQNELTLSKTIVYAYLIKKDSLEDFKIFNANNSKDIIDKSLSLLSGDKAFFKEIKFIIKAIDVLVNKQILYFSDGSLSLLKDDCESELFDNNAFLNKAIIESERMSDKQFLKEVLTIV